MNEPHEVVAQSAVKTQSQRETPRANAALAETLIVAAAPSPEDTPTVGVAEKPTTSIVGRFGDYELLEIIAQGGMGVVFKARQVSLNRIVAFKLIRSGELAGDDEVQRFRAEARAAAALQHPNIVGVHEVGFDLGQHFFSMDYVSGSSLAAMVREHPLPGEQAVRYIRMVAGAIQYAHEHGTLHRDLKPSNVLVDEHDQPRVTDFGLAKKIDGDSALTATGTVLGTPSYMPPEQAAARWSDVGPASDVYSLGATLYELVAGRAPFRAETPFETVRQVLESDPPPPRLLNPHIARDIETICLKCLEKDPRKRYSTARELADELDRFLEGKAIHARPVGSTERFLRWCRRNPGIASLTTVVACLLVGVAALSSWDASRIRTEQAATKKAAKEARDAQKVAEENERQALNNFALARKAVDRMLTNVGLDQLTNVSGMDPTRKSLLLSAKQFYEQLLGQRGDDPDMRAEVGRAYRRVGQIALTLGQPDEGESNLRHAQEIFDDLSRGPDTGGECRDDLAHTLLALGWRAYTASRADEAEFFLRRSIELYETGKKERPDDCDLLPQLALAYGNLGLLYRDTKRTNLAEEMFRSALDTGRHLVAIEPKSATAKSALAASLNNLGNLYGMTRRPQPAMETQSESIRIREDLAREQPNSVQNQTDLATSYGNLALLLDQANRFEPANEFYQKSSASFQRLVQDYPTRVDLILHLSRTRMNHGHMLKKSANQAEAITLYELATGSLEEALRQDPTNARARLFLGNTQHGWAEALEQLKRSAESLPHWDRAIELIGDRIGDILRLGRSVSLARCGDYNRASSDALRLSELKTLEPTDLYDLACILSMCREAASKDEGQSERDALADQYAKASISLLRRAAAVMPAHKFIDPLINDNDIAAIRTLPEFQQLLEEIKQKASGSERQ